VILKNEFIPSSKKNHPTTIKKLKMLKKTRKSKFFQNYFPRARFLSPSSHAIFLSDSAFEEALSSRSFSVSFGVFLAQKRERERASFLFLTETREYPPL